MQQENKNELVVQTTDSEHSLEVIPKDTQIAILNNNQLTCGIDANKYGLSLPWVERTAKGTIHCVYQILCDFLRERCYIFSDGADLYIYIGGYYQKFSKIQWYAFIKSFFPSRYRKKSDWENAYLELLTDNIKSKEEFNPNEYVVNFRNCLLNVWAMRTFPHTPDYISTTQIPCYYISDAKLEDAPNFNYYLNSLTKYSDEECKTVLLEFMGAVLSNVNVEHFKKALILTGEGDTGKSKYRDLLIYNLGNDNNADIDLKNLNKDFGTGNLIGKRLAGCGDMSGVTISDMSILKQLTGGDSVQAVVKYKMGENMHYNGFLLFICNELPKFYGDRGNHAYDRFIIVPCKNKIPKDQQDKNLLNKMKAERDVIASVSMNYIHNVIMNGYNFTEGEAVINAREQYKVENNSLLLFVNECCKLGEGRTHCPMFYTLYAAWCRVNRLTAEPKRQIPILLEQIGIRAKKSNFWYYELTVEADH